MKEHIGSQITQNGDEEKSSTTWSPAKMMTTPSEIILFQLFFSRFPWTSKAGLNIYFNIYLTSKFDHGTILCLRRGISRLTYIFLLSSSGQLGPSGKLTDFQPPPPLLPFPPSFSTVNFQPSEGRRCYTCGISPVLPSAQRKTIYHLDNLHGFNETFSCFPTQNWITCLQFDEQA